MGRAMLHEILVSYGVLLGSAVIAFLTATVFAHGARREQQALQETYLVLRTLAEEQSRHPEQPSYRRAEISI